MTAPAQICGIIKSSGNSLQMVVERGDHIVPNFEEIWPSNKDKDAKYKRRLIGMEYYMDAMEHHGLKVQTLSCRAVNEPLRSFTVPVELSESNALV